ncbi:MAG: GntR family transcriptional regulator [Oscillospiraceae bacterium]|nr:GntR family transcriptional regulator [Oscillospiraceae bacterium]
MDWKFRSDQPIYSQLVEQIKLGIVSGAFLPGERLASVRDMAMEAGVNPNTMQRALQELERDGMVYAQRTAGRFVTEDMRVIDRVKQQFAEEQIRSFLDAMKKLGYRREEIIHLLSDREEKENADS